MLNPHFGCQGLPITQPCLSALVATEQAQALLLIQERAQISIAGNRKRTFHQYKAQVVGSHERILS